MSVIRRSVKCVAGALTILVVTIAVFAAAVHAGYFRELFVRFIAAGMGRQIKVEGSLSAHIFSFNPQLIAERISISNPAWMPAGLTAEVEKASIVFDKPWFGQWFRTKSLKMEGVKLHLVRNAAGHANWQWSDPDKGSGPVLPIMQSLLMNNAHVELNDARRHLQFNGIVSIDETQQASRSRLLRIQGSGELNGRDANFEITADPLATASHDKPYHFTFTERSSGSRLMGRGFLLKPFDFDIFDSAFDGAGADLKDLYFLTGITFVNTGDYHVSGKLERRGTHFRFTDLIATFGQSDLRGIVSIETSSGRPKFDAKVNSQFLRLSDIGARAAHRDSEADKDTPLLLSNAMLNLNTLRRGEADINFRARRAAVGNVSLQEIAATVSIRHGVLTVEELGAHLLEGKLLAHGKLDATNRIPAAALDLKFTDLQLGQLGQKRAGKPPLEGLMQVRIAVTGHGSSLHQVAASSEGTVAAVLPHGSIRTSLAQLTGINLQGLAGLLTQNTEETAVRCAVASFTAHQGVLTTQKLVLDSVPLLITGDGTIHLESEALDLVVQGHPKRFQLLRLRSPILVRGTLTRPVIGIWKRNSIVQAAEAVGLGMALTPIAAVFAFVDPGLAKNADCAALLTAAQVH